MVRKSQGTSIKFPLAGNCSVGCSKISGPEQHRNHREAAKPTDTSVLNTPTAALSDEVKGRGKISVVVVNPKSPDERTKPLLEEVLTLYNDELPSMSYAANTGKESRFLKNCVTNGKYCTLLLKDHTPDGKNNVIAAITYQIIPADTQYAEIPVAAVQRGHQRKGLGTILYQELQMRLQDIGVLTVFCWGDLESEPFWAKQGFVKIAEVDGRGKPRKLRLKADVRRAMCMPGSATLMVCQLGSTAIEKSLVHGSSGGCSVSVQAGLPQISLGSDAIWASPSFSIKTPVLDAPKPSHLLTASECAQDKRIHPAGNDGMYNLTPLNIAGAFALVASQPLCNDVENPTPRSTSMQAQNSSPRLSSMKSPGKLRDEVFKDVTNLTPKPASQRFAALCDVASSLASHAEDQPEKNLAVSATRENEKENCLLYMPEQNCVPGQDNTKASCPGDVDFASEETVMKRPRGVLRTYKKRRGDSKAVVSQGLVVVPGKGAETELLGAEQCPAAVVAMPSTVVSETSQQTRSKKQRIAVASRTGGQTSAAETKGNNAPGVKSRVLRSSSTGKRKHGLTTSVPKAGNLSSSHQRSRTLRVSMKSGANGQTVGLATPYCNDKTTNGFGTLQDHDVLMTEPSESVSHLHGVSGVCELEANHHSEPSNDGCNTKQGDFVNTADVTRKPTSDAEMCQQNCTKDIQPGPHAAEKDATASGTGEEKRESIGLVHPVSTDQQSRQGKEVTNVMDGTENATCDFMTELIVPGDCMETLGGGSLVETGAYRNESAGLVHPSPMDQMSGQVKEVATVMNITENAMADSMALNTELIVADSMALNTELTVTEDCLETWGRPGPEQVEHVVMFMNMANEKRRKQLTQFVEQLGGRVTTQGLECTHVVTGEVRTTLNFCTALCAGAWVVSSNWLRDSVRANKFADPSLYLLHDKNFQMKYEVTVEEVVRRARRTPNSLLKGFQFYPTPNVNPDLETIGQLIRSAGGRVLSSLKEALASQDPSHTVMLACEDDTLEALQVSPRGMWIFSAEWLMSCIVRQDIDFSKPQFAEPLN